MNNWYSRVILLLIVGGALVLSLQYTTSHFKSDRQIILLNTTRPDFHRFLDTEKLHGAAVTKGSLREYFNYFRLVNEAMPDNNEALVMLGYLYEITQDHARAHFYLNKAYQLNSSFFFTEYDLGLLCFEQGDFAQSADFLRNALGIAPQMTFGVMMNSIIYRQFFSSISDNQDIIIDLQQAYHDAYILLVAAMAKQKDAQGENGSPQVYAHIM